MPTLPEATSGTPRSTAAGSHPEADSEEEGGRADAHTDAHTRIPLPPLAGGGEGECYSVGHRGLSADVSLVGRALGDSARYPASYEERVELLGWMRTVARDSPDVRVKVKAATVLIAADKLNLDVARLMLEEERLRIVKPQESQGSGGVVVIIEGSSGKAPALGESEVETE